MTPEDANQKLFLNVFITTVAALIPLFMSIPCKLEECGNYPTIFACISVAILIITSFLSKRWVEKNLDSFFWIINGISIIACYLIYENIEYHLRGKIVFGICVISFLLLFFLKTMKVIREANEFVKDFNEKNNTKH